MPIIFPFFPYTIFGETVTCDVAMEVVAVWVRGSEERGLQSPLDRGRVWSRADHKAGGNRQSSRRSTKFKGRFHVWSKRRKVVLGTGVPAGPQPSTPGFWIRGDLEIWCRRTPGKERLGKQSFPTGAWGPPCFNTQHDHLGGTEQDSASMPLGRAPSLCHPSRDVGETANLSPSPAPEFLLKSWAFPQSSKASRLIMGECWLSPRKPAPPSLAPSPRILLKSTPPARTPRFMAAANSAAPHET